MFIFFPYLNVKKNIIADVYGFFVIVEMTDGFNVWGYPKNEKKN